LDPKESIPPGMQKKILAVLRKRINVINGGDRKVSATMQWHSERVIYNENV